MHQGREQAPLAGDVHEVLAWLAQLDAPQDRPSDAELAAHEVVEGDAAGSDVASGLARPDGEVVVTG